jgi:regulator of replication initiation timing
MKTYYYCSACDNTVEFGHECVMDKITRMDMGNAFNTWLKEQPDAITELRHRVAFANELAGGYDNRGNHVLGAFLTGILQEYDKVVNENMELKHQIHELQLQVGDWKDAAEQTIAAARGTMIDAAGERQLRELIEERIELCKTVAFFASVIKSGESWSDTCQTMYDNTIIHLPSRK